jgi:hypothetical protein
MIELTTGVVFLMSSLYGAGQHGYTEAAVANAVDSLTNEQAVPVEVGTFTNEKLTEAFLRKEFAGAPILVEVARCESEFRQFGKDGKIVRGRVDNADVGLLQVNERYHGETAKKMNIDIYTVEGNVAYAKYLYAKYGTKPWTASEPCWSRSQDLAKK